ncbi:MAG: NmrA/HSCARG family protein [Longimicrobiales bacterium]
MMPDRKVIAVMGATGAQGGGLVRAIIADRNSEFTARAITRDPSSGNAKALADAGADVVSADSYDPGSLEQAFAGAHGIFCVSFYWNTFSPEKEGEEIRNMAAAARVARPRHVIWSTLEDSRNCIPLSDDRMPTLLGNYKVPHFDSKAQCDHLFADLPTTYMLASFYWENFIRFGQEPKPGPDGQLELSLPIGSSKMAGIAAQDVGRCCYGIFKRGADLIGHRIGLAGEHLSGNQMAAAFTKHLGQPVRFNALTPATFRAFGFPGADDLGNMFQYYDECADELNATRDVARSRALNPDLMNFDTWLAANAAAIPIGS